MRPRVSYDSPGAPLSTHPKHNNFLTSLTICNNSFRPYKCTKPELLTSRATSLAPFESSSTARSGRLEDQLTSDSRFTQAPSSLCASTSCHSWPYSPEGKLPACRHSIIQFCRFCYFHFRNRKDSVLAAEVAVPLRPSPGLPRSAYTGPPARPLYVHAPCRVWDASLPYSDAINMHMPTK